MQEWFTMPIDPKKETPCSYGQVFRCKACSFGAIMPRPPWQAVADFYNLENYYTHGKSHFAGAGESTLWDKVRFHLSWRMDFGRSLTPETAHNLLKAKPSDICDIGCGHGEFVAELVGLGHHAVGIEFDIQAAEKARQIGVELHQGSAELLPEEVASRRFKLVTMSHVLEHCLDPMKAFENASKLIQPGGFLVCIVPNTAALGFTYAGLAWEPLDVPRHMNFFEPRNLAMLCDTFGL